jgi:type IV fimbrial biogenesis protein FimT
MPPSTPAHRHRQSGFTLIESLVMATILLIILGAVAPSFSSTIERRRIEGLVNQFETDVRYAQSEAQLRARSVRLSFLPAGTNSCYIVHTGDPNDCVCNNNGRGVCTGTAQALRVEFVQARDRVRISSNSRSLAFNAARQTVTPTATVTFSGTEGRSVKQIVNVMGRVRTCSPQGSISGYKRC